MSRNNAVCWSFCFGLITASSPDWDDRLPPAPRGPVCMGFDGCHVSGRPLESDWHAYALHRATSFLSLPRDSGPPGSGAVARRLRLVEGGVAPDARVFAGEQSLPSKHLPSRGCGLALEWSSTGCTSSF